MERIRLKKLKLAQVSMEFVILLGFILLLTAPMIIFYHSYSNKTRYELSEVQARNIALKIVDNAESVYYFGEPSQTVLKVSIPENIEDIIIANNEVIFRIYYNGKPTDIAVPSNVNLSGSINPNPGLRSLLIKAENNIVNISDY